MARARYPEDRLFEAADIVGGHPGVSHNYRRTHAFNLWYTLGILTVFMILGTLAAFFSFSWGQQSQSEAFQITLAAIEQQRPVATIPDVPPRVLDFVGERGGTALDGEENAERRHPGDAHGVRPGIGRKRSPGVTWYPRWNA